MKPFPYRVNGLIRTLVMYGIKGLVGQSTASVRLDILNERIDKILLVRPTFRIGEAILSSPAIVMFRRRFPRARIDFVGGPVSKVLFENLPIDHHYQITRRFPDASWAYLALLKQIRSVRYDLAVELSCSQSAMGAFIVGFSGSRFRLGREGKRDYWYNVKLPKPAESNKYEVLRTFLGSMGITGDVFPSVVLSATENDVGWKKIVGLIGNGQGPIVGVFVGARKSWGKRWSKEYFLELINGLHAHSIKVIVFAGPEEMDLIDFFRREVNPNVAFAFEPSLRTFASMVSKCHLFIACDSGPMHLACALGVRTVAIFQNPNFAHWGPPPELGTVVYKSGGVVPKDVLRVCLEELPHGGFHSLPQPSASNANN